MFSGIFAQTKIHRLKVNKAQLRLSDVNKAHWLLASSSNAAAALPD